MAGTAGLIKDVQYIDLPGESPRRSMWPGVENVVVLRKHRDVVFDIDQGDGASYTLQAEKDRFWCTKRQLNVTKITFNDGEKAHIWVGRHFRGDLLLKKGETLVGRYRIGDFDHCVAGRCTEDPKEKPAPIIIAMKKNSSAAPTSQAVASAAADRVPTSTQVHSGTDVEHAVVRIVDVSMSGAPDEVWARLQKGGEHTGLADIDPNHIATRNWLMGQAMGALAFLQDNREWISNSMGNTSRGFRFVMAKLHYVRGKARIYFSGFAKGNPVFGPGGFGAQSEKVITIFGGAGELSGSFKGMWAGGIASFKGNAVVSFFFSSATALAEWQTDAKKDGYDFIAAVLVAAVKALLAGALVALAVAIATAVAFFIFGVGMTVFAVGGIFLVGGLLVNYGLDLADKKIGEHVLGKEGSTSSDIVAPWFRKAGHWVEQNWKALDRKMPSDYGTFMILQ
ncbi:hypothetical protein LFL97_10495 [Burkholderia sp. JSH-S8]|nr:hypothetical protein LFL97_10495 [Burkholderia sp. JSH-S8]